MEPAPVSDVYTHGHHDSVLRSHRWRTVENSAAYLIPHLRADSRLLDVGCGPGTITLDLAGRLTAGSVLGIDASETVIAAVSLDAANSAANSAANNVSFEVGDVYALEAADDSFDIVHAHQVLQHLSDPIAALREMRRVCRPDGVVVARDSDYSAMTWHPMAPALDEWLTLYLTLARGNGAEPDAGRHLRSWALQAGFASVDSSASAWCFAEAEDRSWWAATWADRVLESAYAVQAEERGLASRADLERLSSGWREWSTAPDGWFAVLHGEIIARP